MGAELDAGARERLVDALAKGSSVSLAARTSGYSRIHVHRLLKDPAFMAEVDRARAKEVDSEPGDVKAARAFLRKAMDGEIEAGPQELTVRVNAAKALIAAYQGRGRAAPVAVPAPIKMLPTGDGKAAAETWLQSQA